MRDHIMDQLSWNQTVAPSPWCWMARDIVQLDDGARAFERDLESAPFHRRLVGAGRYCQAFRRWTRGRLQANRSEIRSPFSILKARLLISGSVVMTGDAGPAGEVLAIELNSCLAQRFAE